jgi:nucleoid-associated protein YgaU
MSTKAKVALLVLMVGLVVAIVVYDKQFGQSSEPNASGGTTVATGNPLTTEPAPPPPTLPTPPPDTTSRDPFATSPTTTTAPPPPPPSPPVVIDGPATTTAPPTTEPDPFATSPTTTQPDPFASQPPPPVVEPAPDPFTSTSMPPSGSKIHTVKDGDSLWDIAELHYKNGTKWKLIEEANRDKLGEGKFLKVGMDLVIPDLPTRVPAPASASSSREPGPGEYRVREGDSLWTIAESELGSGTLMNRLKEANADLLKGNPNRLKVGMILRIPSASATPDRGAIPPPSGRPDLREESVPADLVGKRTYRIKSGDSLWKIAERELGDGLKWQKIYDANRSRLPSKTDLKVGTVIVIPE